jgi:branched-chain amino acid transport system ATP-binding protein
MEKIALSVKNVTKAFSKFVAIDDLSIDLNTGEILGLIGPNGSGKSTLINVVSGIFKPDKGHIELMGKEISSLSPHKICHYGLNRTFQTPRPLESLTIEENVKIAMLYGRKDRKFGNELTLEAILRKTHLLDIKNRMPDTLNAFQRKMLDLSRAIATEPKVIMVDELAAGLNQDELKQVNELLTELLDLGMSIVVVEHIMSFIKEIAHRVVVLDAGKKIFEGGFKEATEDEYVKEVYLGKRHFA